MRKLKYILNSIGFLSCYFLFVYVNGQTMREAGGWCDLNWIGIKDMGGLPSISFAFGMIFQSPLWVLFNIIVISLTIFFEYNIYKLYHIK